MMESRDNGGAARRFGSRDGAVGCGFGCAIILFLALTVLAIVIVGDATVLDHLVWAGLASLTWLLAHLAIDYARETMPGPGLVLVCESILALPIAWLLVGHADAFWVTGLVLGFAGAGLAWRRLRLAGVDAALARQRKHQRPRTPIHGSPTLNRKQSTKATLSLIESDRPRAA